MRYHVHSHTMYQKKKVTSYTVCIAVVEGQKSTIYHSLLRRDTHGSLHGSGCTLEQPFHFIYGLADFCGKWAMGWINNNRGWIHTLYYSTRVTMTGERTG